MRNTTALIIAAVTLAAPTATALEVTIARDARDAAAPSTSSSMPQRPLCRAAYNDFFAAAS